MSLCSTFAVSTRSPPAKHLAASILFCSVYCETTHTQSPFRCLYELLTCFLSHILLFTVCFSFSSILSLSPNMSKDAGLRATAEVALICYLPYELSRRKEKLERWEERYREMESKRVKGLYKMACFQECQLWDALIKGAIIRAASDKQRTAFISICFTLGRNPTHALHLSSSLLHSALLLPTLIHIPSALHLTYT